MTYYTIAVNWPGIGLLALGLVLLALLLAALMSTKSKEHK